MNEMVERVAKAIDDAEGHATVKGFGAADKAIHMARAAIAAMREPTEDMIAEGEACDDCDSGNASAVVHWLSMIDAALATTSEAQA